MTVEAFRIQNFMGFEDSGWLELRPITMLFGRNSTGKSAILRALLLLRQSLTSQTEDGPLVFVSDDGFDFGSYREMVRNHQIRYLISFWFRCQLSPDPDDRLGALNVLGPLRIRGTTVKVRLAYGLSDDKQSIGLHSVDLYDNYGNVILQATSSRLSWKGSRPWVFASDLFEPHQEEEPNPWRHAYFTTPSGFLPQLRVIGAAFDRSEDYGQRYKQVELLVRSVHRSVSQYLTMLEYLGPLRGEPRRFYYTPGQATERLAREGHHIVRNLLNAQQDPAKVSRLQSINEWLAESGLKVRLELKPLDKNKTLFELLVSETAGGANSRFRANLREVGFGISQVLPVVVQTLLAPENSLVIIEQPELHLHPGAQAQLGDLMIRVVSRHKMGLLIETHSEHLLLRIRRRIAESSVGRIKSEENDYFRHDNLRVYFVDRNGGKSTAEEIEINSVGEMTSPPSFRGFFADDLRETARLTSARLGIDTSGV